MNADKISQISRSLYFAPLLIYPGQNLRQNCGLDREFLVVKFEGFLGRKSYQAGELMGGCI